MPKSFPNSGTKRNIDHMGSNTASKSTIAYLASREFLTHKNSTQSHLKANRFPIPSDSKLMHE